MPIENSSSVSRNKNARSKNSSLWRRNGLRSLGAFSIIVSEVIGLTGLALAIGYALRTYFGYSLGWVVATTGVGFLIAMIRVVFLGIQLEKQLERDEESDSPIEQEEVKRDSNKW